MKPTTSQLGTLLNRKAWIKMDGLTVTVAVRDVKTAYGHVRVQIGASEGDGSRVWVDASRLVFTGPQPDFLSE